MGYFPSKRGLRQGDPMSPYLFVLGVEYLARVMEGLNHNPRFKFHPRCKVLKVKSLAFADDLMAFCKADYTSPILLKEALDEFLAASGLSINLQKSNIFFAAVNPSLKQYLLSRLGFKEGKLPMKYLGVPLIDSKLTVDDCQPIIEKIKKKLNMWCAKKLSYAGKMELINSVPFHYQVYWSNIFLLPSAIMNCINALCRRFLWAGQLDKRPYALVAWNDICLPRIEGGLSIKQLKCWNRAAFSKQLWKIVSRENCLWTKWANCNYLKGKSVWALEPRQDDPWTWKKLLKARSGFRDRVETIIGDGRQTSLFYDNWLKCGNLARYMNSDMHVWGEEAIVQQWWQCGKGWNIPQSFSRIYPQLAEEISKVRLDNGQDIVKWKNSQDGWFSVAHYYSETRLTAPKVNWYRLVWSGKIPARHKFIVWLLVRQRLKTKDLLVRRGMSIDTTCTLCNDEVESCQHLFFKCEYSAVVWKTVLARIDIRRSPLQWDGEFEWLRTTCKGRNVRSRLVRQLFAATVYMIWGERNNRVFGGEPANHPSIVANINRTISLLNG